MSAHKRPAPLLTRATATATISGLSSLLVTVGVLPATVGKQITTTGDAVVAAVGLLLSTVPVIVHALTAQKVVTPVTDPRTNDGTRLVPVGSDLATLDAANILAQMQATHPTGP